MVTMRSSHVSGPSLPYTIEELAAALLHLVRMNPRAGILPRLPPMKTVVDVQPAAVNADE